MKILAIDKILPGATEEKIYPHIKEEADPLDGNFITLACSARCTSVQTEAVPF